MAPRKFKLLARSAQVPRIHQHADSLDAEVGGEVLVGWWVVAGCRHFSWNFSKSQLSSRDEVWIFKTETLPSVLHRASLPIARILLDQP
jgi:hypothetical protein